MDSKISRLHKLYADELTLNVLPFWQNNSIDHDFGGYFTCLLQDGSVYDKDKFVWLQARQVWTFAKMYNELEQKKAYLDTALHGASFLLENGQDENGDWFFSLDQKGQPLVQAYNIFSDCFACMAFGQLFKATDDPLHRKIALETFEKIIQRQNDPKGQYNKIVPGTRDLKNFALPMILANLSMEIQELLIPALFNELQENCVKAVMDDFMDDSTGLIFENINQDGSFSDSFEGRLLNPGHGLEAMWFIMDIAAKKNDMNLIKKCAETSITVLNHSWDKEYGGIYYFMDIKGYPPQQLEWNQKLWWVHLEASITCLKAYQQTGEAIYWDWFEKIHNYQWKHFKDRDNPEWFGYLNRDGSTLTTLKGGKWKGCFHVPRALLQISSMLEKLKSTK